MVKSYTDAKKWPARKTLLFLADYSFAHFKNVYCETFSDSAAFLEETFFA